MNIDLGFYVYLSGRSEMSFTILFEVDTKKPSLQKINPTHYGEM